MTFPIVIIVVIVILVVIAAVLGVHVVNQYELGVVFRLGRVRGVKKARFGRDHPGD